MNTFPSLISPETLTKICDGFSRWLLYILLLFLPLFFLPWSLDILEVNKQTLLVLLTLFSALFWLGKMLCERKFVFRGGWITLLPLLLFGGVFISGFFSQGKYLSWIGTSTQEYTSILSYFAYLVLFYLLMNILDTEQKKKKAVLILLVSAFLTGLVGLLSLFGIHFSFAFADSRGFNTIGTLNNFALYLTVMGLFGISSWLAQKKESGLLYHQAMGIVEYILIGVISLIGFFFLLFLDFWILWVVLLVGLAVLFIYVLLRAQEFGSSTRLILPFFMFIISLLFLFWLPSFIPISVPIEVSPNFKESFSIATKTLVDTSWPFGSGPGTFVYDYTKFHSQLINNTQFWDVRFDRAASYLLTIFATTGLVGAAMWVIFLVSLLVVSLKKMVKIKNREEWAGTLSLFVPWLALVVVLGIYSVNISLLFLFFVLSGLLAAQGELKEYVKFFATSPRAAIVSSFMLVVMGTLVLTVIFVTGQRYFSEVAFAKAVRLDRSQGNIDEIVKELERASTINKRNDIYFRNLTQALLLKLQNEIDSLDATDQITPEKRQYIQDLTSATTNAAVRATTIAPQNSLNWLTLGTVYRELMPLLKEAGNYSVSALKTAIDLEPNNPAYRSELGRTYTVMADFLQPLLASKDEVVKQENQTAYNQNLQDAETAFTKALELKPDYATASYYLAFVNEKQGRLDDAIKKMETVAGQNNKDVGVVFQLGMMYLRRKAAGDLDKAQVALEYAISLAPAYSNARWYLASVYEQKGNLAKAIEQLEKVLELNPDNKDVQIKLEQLRSGAGSKIIPSTLDEGAGGVTNTNQ